MVLYCAVCIVRPERRRVREVEVEKWLRATPSKSKASSHLFRNLSDRGQNSTSALRFMLSTLITYCTHCCCCLRSNNNNYNI